MKRFLLPFLLFAVVFAPKAARSLTADDHYVRTANYFLRSGPVLDNPATLEQLARYDLLVLPAEAQLYNRGAIASLRRLHPDILIIAYVPTVSFNFAYWHDSLHQNLLSRIQDSYWLTDASGSRKTIWPNTQALNLNSGWTDELIRFAAEDVMATGLWDGIFFDEVGDGVSWVAPIDTDRNGQNDQSFEADQRWQNGYVRLFSGARARLGPQAVIVTNGSSNTAFRPYVNGRMFESFPTPWEAGGNWGEVMRRYVSLEDTVGYPSVQILNADTGNTGVQTNYQKVRFGLTSTLLGNGYFGFDYGTEDHAQVWRYDEYDVALGTPRGEPEDLLNPGNQTLRESVWGRDFLQGKVLVNATGASQRIRLDGDYEHLRGSQDPITNNGRITSRVTLAPQDGVLLLRPLEHVSGAAFLNGAFTRIWNSTGQMTRAGFFAYDSRLRGGQHVYTGDLNHDGRDEAVAANATEMTILDENGATRTIFFPYTDRYRLGINFAVGDLENDGRTEIVTGTGNGGGPQVRIFNHEGVLIHPGFFAYDPLFRGGVEVALGDVDGDGVDEVITGAGFGGGPHVRIFNKDGRLLTPGFFAYDPRFRGGVHVAAGDVDGDGVDEIITGAGRGGGPHVRIFDRNGTLKGEFFVGEVGESSGVEISAADVDQDGRANILTFSEEVFTFTSL